MTSINDDFPFEEGDFTPEEWQTIISNMMLQVGVNHADFLERVKVLALGAVCLRTDREWQELHEYIDQYRSQLESRE